MVKGTKWWRLLKVFGTFVVVWALLTVGITLCVIHRYDDDSNERILVFSQHHQQHDAMASSTIVVGSSTSDRPHPRQEKESRRKSPLDEIRDDIKKIRNQLVRHQKPGGYSRNYKQETLPKPEAYLNSNYTFRWRQHDEVTTQTRIRNSTLRNRTYRKPAKQPSPRHEIVITDQTHMYETQGRPMICVQRDVRTSRCELYPCHHNNSDLTNATDEYGFVVHPYNNTHGRRMVTSGSAVAGSGCAISHVYQFLYIHVLKSGGMTVKAFLKRGLCGTATSCEALKIVNCAQAIIEYPHYFTFSFVRNPFSRMYSAYSMAESMKGRTNFQWSFHHFVLMNKSQRHRVSRTSPSHYVPQVNFLFDSAHCPVVDFVGRLERFTEDLQIILKQINSSELLSYFESQGNVRENCTSYGERKKQAELDGNLSNAYHSPQMIQAVVEEFRSDFLLLRYDPTKVP
jgi:hypothetical protein